MELRQAVAVVNSYCVRSLPDAVQHVLPKLFTLNLLSSRSGFSFFPGDHDRHLKLSSAIAEELVLKLFLLLCHRLLFSVKT